MLIFDSHIDGQSNNKISGSAISCKTCSKIKTKNTFFKNLTGQNGGAIFAEIINWGIYMNQT